VGKRKRRAIRKGYFLGIGIGIAVVVIAVLLFIGTAPRGAKASIMLKDEQGNPITASRIILDNTDLGSATGEITPEVLDVGEHTIIIFWSGAKYTKTFYYSEGETIILVQLSSPVETRISVWNKNLNQPIANVTVYVDGEVKGTTSTDGLVTVTLEPGSHTFRLLGSGVSHEEIRATSAEANFVEFKVERTSTITISVSDELTGSPVEGAAVYVDAVYKGETSAGGSLEISDVKDGQHEIEARYKGSSESKSVTVTQTTMSFGLSIPVPRTITLTVNDEETGLPADGIDIYIDDVKKGTTTQNGELVIEDILPGRHKVGLDVPSYTQMVERYIDVGMQESVSLAIDMPNPEFSVSVRNLGDYGFPDRRFDVEVTLKNMGDVPSKDTTAIILVYHGSDDFQSVKDSAMLDFGDMAGGGLSRSEEFTNLDFDYWNGTRVFVVVVDRWEYTPQSGTIVAEVSTEEALLLQLGRQAWQYMEEHPEIVGKIASMFLSRVL